MDYKHIARGEYARAECVMDVWYIPKAVGSLLLAFLLRKPFAKGVQRPLETFCFRIIFTNLCGDKLLGLLVDRVVGQVSEAVRCVAQRVARSGDTSESFGNVNVRVRRVESFGK